MPDHEKATIRLATAFALAGLLAACARSQPSATDLSRVHRQKTCQEAIPIYSEVIRAARDSHKLFQAYYYRAECQAEAGLRKEAYADYLNAQAKACQASRDGPRGGRSGAGDLVASMVCNDVGPAKIREAGGLLTSEEAEEIREKASP